MNRHRILSAYWCVCSAVVLAIGLLLVPSVRGADLVDPAKVDALAKPLVDGKWTFGLVVGLVNEQGTQIQGYGRTSDTNDATPGADTIFEIGSVSKVFTGLLLAEAVAQGKAKLDEPVQKLLGDSMTVPKGEREITLVDLATHSSGLPRLPSNLLPKDVTNPYADYSVEQLGKFLGSHKLRRQPGKKSEYSNLGMGLLGRALALRADSSYEALLTKNITQPLGMDDTFITLDDARRARLAQGHNASGKPEPNWDLPTFAGAGAIRSDVSDMLKFVGANLGLTKTPLDAALAASHEIHFKPDDSPHNIALGWHVRQKDGVIWHNGQTGGYHSIVAFLPEKKAGVVVLANTAGLYIDELGFSLLTLLTTGKADSLGVPQAIEVAASDLEPLVGKYDPKPVPMATVTLDKKTPDKAQLYLQLVGQPKIAIYPESKTRFFCREVDAQFDFELNDKGEAERMVIHQAGLDFPAPRVVPKESADAKK